MFRAPLARLAPFAALLAMGAAVGAIVVACGTDAVGVDACRQIEEARCNQAPNCAAEISLSAPLHPGGSAGDVAACIRFYDDACQHGLATGVAPGQPAVSACVAAINAEATDGGGGCDIVLHPEEAGACAWLIPPADVVDAAAADADADDGDDGSDETGDDGG
jgi:hypothetical protein